MKEFVTPSEISEVLGKIGDKKLECIYVKTNIFDIYIRDADQIKIVEDRGKEYISFNTRVNLEKFPVEVVERVRFDTTEFELFEDFYDEDDDCEFFCLYFKGSEVKIYFCINLEEN